MPWTVNGIGTMHIGRANCVLDDANKDEEFDTTLWFVFFLVPIIPLKSYRIRQKQGSLGKEATVKDGLPGHAYTFYIIKKYSLNWKQIIKIYLLIYGSLTVSFTVAIFLIRLFAKK